MYQINTTYRIDSDRLNFILQKKCAPRKEGKETWINVGYYTTIQQLYHALVELGLKERSLHDIKGIYDKVEELHQLIEKMPRKSDRDTE